MTADLQDLFDRAGRNPPASALDPDAVLRRAARRSRGRRITAAVAAALVVVLAVGVGLASQHRAEPLPPAHPSPSPSIAAVRSVRLLAGSPGHYGFANGDVARARFDSPDGLAVGPTGTVYMTDFSSTLHRSVIRAITRAGHVTTLADEPANTWDQGFRALTVDASGTVYVLDGQEIRMIGPNGQILPLVGAAGKTRFDRAIAIAVSPTGDLYATGAGLVHKVTPDGMVSTLKGCDPALLKYVPPAPAGCLGWPSAIVVSPSGTIYIGSDDYMIRTIAPDGTVRTLAAGEANVLFSRMSIAFDPARSLLWVLDTAGLHTIAADGTVSTVRLTGSLLSDPMDQLAIGPDGTLYAIDEAGAVVTLTSSG
jgi:DNA-binding beta-propeller fold protein YncE